jgi:flagellar biogenesis protein FliO
MPYLHDFKESLNNQEIIRKQTVKIHILVFLIFLFAFFLFLHYMFKGRIETNENRRRAGELVTLYFLFFFHYMFKFFFVN